eukprot:15166172-Alexandrium_andersonii.AAC.1
MTHRHGRTDTRSARAQCACTCSCGSVVVRMRCSVFVAAAPDVRLRSLLALVLGLLFFLLCCWPRCSSAESVCLAYWPSVIPALLLASMIVCWVYLLGLLALCCSFSVAGPE